MRTKGEVNFVVGSFMGWTREFSSSHTAAKRTHIEDSRVQAEITRKYQKEKFGNTLPFVVITDSHGKALASSGGYKSAEAWTALTAEAKKKAAAQGSAASR